MSRAFVNDDAAGEPLPEHRYPLPPREDPSFLRAAAEAMLQGADVGDSIGAEEATGFSWGAKELIPEMRDLLAEARRRGRDRQEQLAERYLRAAGEEIE
jgi:hypothetical protein